MSRYNDEVGVTVIQKPAISLETIGVITWIVFMILDYGYHVEWLNQNNPHPHFWTWFPLWAPIALSAAILIICIIIALVAGAIVMAIERDD